MNLTENHSRIPHIHVGMRMIKTTIAVFLSLCLAYFRGGFANPLYIAVAAILCIQPTLESTKTVGINRIIATFIGGFWGLLVFLTNMYVFQNMHTIFKYAVVSVCIIPLIYSIIYVKRSVSVITGSVVYLIITVSPVGRMTALQFVFNRLLDTFMGMAIAFAINAIKLPTEAEIKAKAEERKAKKE